MTTAPPLEELLAVLDDHANRLQRVVQPMPLHLQTINHSLLSDLYPYDQEALLHRTLSVPLTSDKAQADFVMLLEHTNSAVNDLRDIFGYHAYDRTGENAWTIRLAQHFHREHTMPQGLHKDPYLLRTLGAYVHALDPRWRQSQRDAAYPIRVLQQGNVLRRGDGGKSILDKLQQVLDGYTHFLQTAS